MLIQQLRSLETAGVVSRKVYAEVPPKVEYRLTELGLQLRPVFSALLNWADLQRAALAESTPTQVREKDGNL
jgi:DNA-binding HxlR family transcriptional regulator